MKEVTDRFFSIRNEVNTGSVHSPGSDEAYAMVSLPVQHALSGVIKWGDPTQASLYESLRLDLGGDHEYH